MAKPVSVLVEDDPQQIVVTVGLLQDAGFAVRSFEASEPALAYLQDPDELVDLFVLDRRLPFRLGDEPTDAVGDELRSQVRSTFPDARVIVFTGFADIRQVQDAHAGAGQLPSVNGKVLDRVSVFEKTQSIEFQDSLQEYSGLLNDLSAIEILSDTSNRDIEPLSKRVLRRIGCEYGALSVRPTSFDDGFSDSRVWKVDLHGESGLIGVYVAKVDSHEKEASTNTLLDLLPRKNAATRLSAILGLIGGAHVQMYQLAAEQSDPLFSHVTDVETIGETIARLQSAFAEIPDNEAVQAIETLAAPLITWDDLTRTLDEISIEPPSRNLQASTTSGVRHGDLHGANVLMDQEDPVVIDDGSCCQGPGLLDPVVLLLSSLVHPSSEIRGELWPDTAEIEGKFGQRGFGVASSGAAFFEAMFVWIESKQKSPREFWALVLAYSARQLAYEDVLQTSAIVDRVHALILKAVSELSDS